MSPSSERPTREAGAALLARLMGADLVLAPTLQANELLLEPLPDIDLYPGHRFFRVVVLLRQRPLVLDVVDDGERAIFLGSPERVAELNRRAGLQLRAEDAVPYVRFWFARGAPRTVTIVEAPEDCDWLPTSETEADVRDRRERASSLIEPPRLLDHAGPPFEVEVTVLDQRKLLRLRLRVHPDGTAEESNRSVLQEEVPVTYVLP